MPAPITLKRGSRSMALWPGEPFHHSTSWAASRSVRMAMISPAPLFGLMARGSVQKLARCSITSRVAMLSDQSWDNPATVGWYLTLFRPLATRYSLILVKTVRMAAELLSGTRASVDRLGAAGAVSRVAGGDARSWSGAQSGGIDTVRGAGSTVDAAGAGGGVGSVAGWTAGVEGAAGAGVGAGAGAGSVSGDATRISGSTAGVRRPAEAPPAVDAPPPCTSGAASEMPAAPAWVSGNGEGGAVADDETSANAQSTPRKDGATNLFTTSPALLCHPGRPFRRLSFATLAPRGHSNNGKMQVWITDTVIWDGADL